MFGFAGTLVPIIFIIIIVLFVVTAVRGISQWHQNNQSPELTVEARLAAKRSQVTHHTDAPDANGIAHSHTDTSYFLTFEVESGDRMEFRVPGREYGLLAEGDRGRLTFQGTRYKGFQRS